MHSYTLLPPLGPAFTVVYVIAGLPLARLADTRSRSVVLIVGVGFWSVMVFLTGFVKQFWQLLVLRMFLGIGEVSTGIVCSRSQEERNGANFSLIVPSSED